MKRPIKILTSAVLLSTALASYSIANAADKIKLTMNWTADSAHLGFAVAQKNGYYAAEGLEVELEEGRGSSVAAQLVATGQSELGYADAGAALNVASQGAPIKIIATIWKAGQFGLSFLDTASIQEPKDLVGKKVAVAPGGAEQALMQAFLNANGIDESSVEVVSASAKSFMGLLTEGQVDAVAETPENIGIPLSEQGIETRHMYFYDHGVPLISLSLIAREDKLEANPDLYKRFLRATLKGWQEAMRDPEASAEALKAVFPETSFSKDALLEAAKYSFGSVCPAAGSQYIGVTPKETWDRVYEVMTTAMDFSEEKPITAYYSADYLPSEPPACP